MKAIGFTSTFAGPSTAKSIEHLRRSGLTPIVITERANRKRIKEYLAAEDFNNAVTVSAFRNVSAAANELEQALNQRAIKLSNWINITDDTTAFFLASCDRLNLQFDFRTAYEQSRIKPLARKILSARGLGNVSFRTHPIDDRTAPKGFLFPFIAKPILGAGSSGVAIISGSKQWREYLRTIGRSIGKDTASLRDYDPGNEILIEEIIPGTECQIDGYVEQGKVEVCALGLKQTNYGPHGFREASGLLYRPLSLQDSRNHDLSLIEWANAVLSALGFVNGTFHIEAKVTGSEIRLLEVNPRPGGGANVSAIKSLSGVDLNSECIRLWAGLPQADRERPTYKSLCFAVRYPSIIGFAKSVRKSGIVANIKTSTNSALDWIPLIVKGDALDPHRREQYLGVLLAPDHCKEIEGFAAAAQELFALVQRRDFVSEIAR